MTFPAQLVSFFTSRQGPTTAFSNPGTYTTTVPDGVTMMSAVCIGGGGGGAGGSNSSTLGSGGGGGGGLSWGVFSVNPGDILRIVVGAGGAGGATGGNGGSGGVSSLTLDTRSGVSINEPILQAGGGNGGTRTTLNSGGEGGTGNLATTNSSNFSVYLRGGGNGGNGGSANSSSIGAGGGGGAGGYNGNGGNGGGTNPNTAPTAAALNSGGGGGGGSSSSGSATGYGGGGVGAFGYPGTGQGGAGSNDTGGGGTGGSGGSFFNDPGAAGVFPDLILETLSTGNTLTYPTSRQIIQDDFLLLLSGSDKDSGILELPVPAGFTTLSKSYNGVYTVNTGSATTAVIPSNVTVANATRDLNFASSYRYVTEQDVVGTGGTLTGSIVGLATTAIHNLIVLRSVPNPSNIQFATSSGDPGINTTSPNFVGTESASPMPDPPSISNIPKGALSIALGFLSNTLLSPDASNIAGDDSTTIGSINGGVPPDGTAVMAAYLTNLVGAGVTVNPAEMKTGTASHARAYSIEIRRATSGVAISTVGYAGTSTYQQSLVGGGTTVIQPPTTLNLPSSIAPGDLIIYVGTSDTRRGKTDSTAKGGKTLAAPNFGSGGSTFDTLDFAGPGQGSLSNDTRGGGSLAFRIAYRVYQSGDPLAISALTTETDPILSQTAAIAHSVIVLRGTVQYGLPGNPSITNYTVWDNGDPVQYPLDWTGSYGPPNPPALTTVQANSMILQLGMLDNVTISNVTDITPPFGQGIGNTAYELLAKQSYGEQNNGAIIMSAARVGLSSAASENPSAFEGAGANIWVSQTIVIGGEGGETTATNLAAGRYGGGGGGRLNTNSGTGVAGAGGAVRIIYGNGRQYPSANQGNVQETW